MISLLISLLIMTGVVQSTPTTTTPTPEGEGTTTTQQCTYWVDGTTQCTTWWTE